MANGGSTIRLAASSLPRVNVSFSGCGFLGIYHVGSLACWRDHIDRSVSKGPDASMETGEPPRFEVDHALGASVGALVAAALVLNFPANAMKKTFMEVTERVKSMAFGPFNPRFDVTKIFGDELDKMLPADAHKIVDNHLHVSLTDTAMQNVIQCQFNSRKDLMDALVCSCFLPAFSSYQVPTFSGRPFFDGGFSNNQPVLDGRTTVRVSPFAGGSHICPNDGTPEERRLVIQRFGGEKQELSFANVKRLFDAMLPAEDTESLYRKGYEQTDEFIRSGKIVEFFSTAGRKDHEENASFSCKGRSGPKTA